MNITASGFALRRRNEIQKLVKDGGVRSQEVLQRLLRQRGIAVAQATLSRDLKDLGLAKTATGYVTPFEVPAATAADRLDRALKEFVLSVEVAASLVVIRTPPAAAHPVARALDESPVEEVVGTIAGDDTIFLATRGEAVARRLARRLLETIEGNSGRIPEPLRPVRPSRRPRAS